MKQPNFNREADDKYNKFENFRLKVNNILASYNTPHAEQLAIIKDWLAVSNCKRLVRQERPAINRIPDRHVWKQEKCSTIEGLFEILNNRFKPQFNETRKSLQFCKLSRQSGENTGGMDRQTEASSNRL